MAEDTLNIVQKKVAVELEIDPTLKAPKVNRYQWLIDLSEAVDAWRIFPRVFISTYIYLLYKTTIWFTTLPDPNTAQAGLISVVVGAGAAWFCLLYTSPSPRDRQKSRMPSSA